jgi:hypothetical protein
MQPLFRLFRPTVFLLVSLVAACATPSDSAGHRLLLSIELGDLAAPVLRDARVVAFARVASFRGAPSPRVASEGVYYEAHDERGRLLVADAALFAGEPNRKPGRFALLHVPLARGFPIRVSLFRMSSIEGHKPHKVLLGEIRLDSKHASSFQLAALRHPTPN